jgi:hypothetical protein
MKAGEASMRIGRLILVVMVGVALLVATGEAVARKKKGNGGAGGSQTTTPSSRKEADEALATHWEAFCTSVHQKHWACAEGIARQGHKWLVLEEYCQSNSQTAWCKDYTTAHEANKPLVLAFDHPTGRWYASHGLAALEKRRIEKDISGLPTVRLKKSEDLIVMIERTNPLLYSLKVTESKEEDIPDLARIQELVDLAAGYVATMLKVQQEKVDPSTMTTMTAVSDDQAKTPKREELEELMKILSCYVAETDEQQFVISAFLQSLVLGKEEPYSIDVTCPAMVDWAKPIKPKDALAVKYLEKVFRELTAAYLELAQDPFVCGEAFQTFENALNSDPKQRPAFNATLAKFRAQKKVDCKKRALELANEFDQAIQPVERASDANFPAELKKLKGDTDLRTKIQGAILYAGAEAKLLESVKNVLPKRGEIHKSLAQVELFERKLERHRLPTHDGTNAGNKVEKRVYLTRDATPTRWDKTQTHSIKIEGDEALLGRVAASLPKETTTSYKVGSDSNSLWGIGAALTQTSLKDPTFSAVTDPDNAGQKIIGKTKEDSRAGQYALLFDYQIVQHLAPGAHPAWRALGLEFGAGLDSDDPSLFAGVNVRLGRWVRIGAGITSQSVTTLAGGQRTGDTVAQDSDIRTKETFEEEPYFSLSFRLESIKVGGKK